MRMVHSSFAFEEVMLTLEKEDSNTRISASMSKKERRASNHVKADNFDAIIGC